MYFRTPDPGEKDELAAIRKLQEAAWDERDALPKEERGTPRPDFEEYMRNGGDPFSDEFFVGVSDRYRAAQRRVEELSAAYDAAHKSYFRFNIFGMSRCSELMWELGMTFADEPHPEWPEPEAYGITWDIREQWKYPEYYEKEPPLSGHQISACERFEAAHDEVLRTHVKGIPGIPGVKFSSNDSWLVTPEECQAALAIEAGRRAEMLLDGEDAYRKFIERQLPLAKWEAWLRYIQEAATHDGFEVR